jgi:predicted SprT family Zn-dependent metalloprotease
MAFHIKYAVALACDGCGMGREFEGVSVKDAFQNAHRQGWRTNAFTYKCSCPVCQTAVALSKSKKNGRKYSSNTCT